MKIYVAASWGRWDEAHKLADMLECLGWVVTSRWLLPQEPNSHQARAFNDVEDILDADVLVRISDKEIMEFPLIPAKFASGARMFETGYAYANGKSIVVLGGYQNTFDYLPGITVVENEEQLIKELYKIQEDFCNGL